MVIFHLLFIMFLWSYLRTIYSSSASPSKKFRLSKSDKEQYEKEDKPEIKQEILERAAKDLPILTRAQNNDIRYCDRCKLMKPDRCHHCSTCDKCVLKMDHHCPWANNCIGFSNYKFFLLFLMYGGLYCLFICATTLQYIQNFWVDKTDTTKIKLATMFFMSAAFFTYLIILFSCHCWLVIKNQSTIEKADIGMFSTACRSYGNGHIRHIVLFCPE
ncbi:palmitoyltransferase ZDHHC20-like [Spea bombifrons]|uniref:palmitoyltransferase ZDHHC20-like n=1 Tax=Spea bombifrons TaxID=233779 RepID=UPI00234A4096|nr:palmitoyltransferase ZDHHC20-like [Spea bombifrons]